MLKKLLKNWKFMSRFLIIGLMTEGPTDVRFLKSIVSRTFEDILYESEETIELYDVQHLNSKPGTFVDKVLNAAEEAQLSGITILCIHTDADSKTDEHTYINKITPAMESIYEGVDICKNIVPIVPVYMTESWMLADIDLLKEEIMTTKTNNELGLTRSPESIADPKTVIKNAINIAQADVSKRRRRYELSVGDIYLPLGQKIDIRKLEMLPSYTKFRNDIYDLLKTLHFIK
jgi:Domain of unknown function (DUF4276)